MFEKRDINPYGICDMFCSRKTIARSDGVKDRLKKEIKDYFLIIIGTLMLTIGVYFFKIPNGFATGGVSGIGTILGKIVPNVSAGSWILIINVVLLLLGFAFLGRQNGIRTVFCSLLFSFTVPSF